MKMKAIMTCKTKTWKIVRILLLTMVLMIQAVHYVYADDSDSLSLKNNILFVNEASLSDVFEKLYKLESEHQGKVNIVHIGDSHIQAGFFTGTIKRSLQDAFGDGGVGFSFPYGLVKTNGPKEIKYATNAAWTCVTNLKNQSEVEVGLSGRSLVTSTSDFAMQLKADSGYYFNKVKVLFAEENAQYRASLSVPELKMTSTVSTGGQRHKIKSGESLSVIARKYGTTVAKLKSANNMKSDRINAGKTLTIPSKNVVQVSNVKIDDNIDFVSLDHKPYCSVYSDSVARTSITIFPEGKQSKYTLNGFVVENEKPGIIYHSIGVNGAQISNYSRYPLFFKQLPELEPDLVILSFGTNESFGRVSVGEYMFMLESFVDKVRESAGDVPVLVMSPPPSMIRRTRTNTLVDQYTEALQLQEKFPVWDLYSNMGGKNSIGNQGEYAKMMDRYKVHYTQQGYEMQGILFTSNFLSAYENYKKQK